MESIELIKLYLDTQGNLLRFQKNTELKKLINRNITIFLREKILGLQRLCQDTQFAYKVNFGRHKISDFLHKSLPKGNKYQKHKFKSQQRVQGQI